MQPAEELLTIIMVTSPVPSNPSTEMLEHVLSSCATAGGFEACAKIVVSDGFRVARACLVMPAVDVCGAGWQDSSGLLSAMLTCPQLKYVGLPTKASLARTDPSHLASNWHLQPQAWEGAAVDFKLRPLCLWYDSAHICRLEHYRDFVFRKGRDWSGGFPEDSFGQDHAQYHQMVKSAKQKHQCVPSLLGRASAFTPWVGGNVCVAKIM
ncbi:unnamed protein product [Symbiodinium pilosum]|uniref:Uncharacterized protein n=1 Tax=Symbiodinium pilosum TaxID=2952 RepID=A0A812W4V4_SYMPI|nr:unnamed protein product [Symbiodinium pilosum]